MKVPARVSVASILWLLVASTWVFVLAGQSTPARAFEDQGEYAETVIGQPDFVSSTFAATQSGLGNPYAPTFDSSGNMWVADEVNHRVLEFKPPFYDGMNASLVLGQPNFTSSAITTTQSGTSEVPHVTFDAQGDLWVSDWINNRILEFKPPFTDGMDASLVLGQPNFTSTQAFSHPPGQFVNPHLANQLAAPVGAAFDSSGDLWVADRANNRVVEYKPPFSTGMDASLVLGQANLTAYSFSVTPTASSLFGPNTIAFDSQGDLWVSDQDDNRILEFAASSLISDDPKAILELGQPAGPYEFANRTSTDTPNGLFSPTGIAFDSSGDLWVVDHGNNRILEFKPPFSDGMSPSLEIGQAAGPTAFINDSSGTTQDGFSNPLGLAFDQDGNLWVADQNNNRILEFSSQATETAGTTVSIANATSLAPSAANPVSCSQVGTEDICHIAVAQPSVGVTTDATGSASWETANVYSSSLGLQAPAGEGSSPFGTSSYYGYYLSGLSNGTAKVCVAGRGSSGGMAYYSAGVWSTSPAISGGGSSTCGDIPLTAMRYGPVTIAVASTGSTSSPTASAATLALEAAEAAVLLGGGAAVLVMLARRRNRAEATQDEEQDEGLDEWV